MVITEVNTKEKTFREEIFGGRHQIYSNQSLEIMLTVHSDRTRVTKDMKFRNPQDDSFI